MTELNEEDLRLRLNLYGSTLPSALVRWNNFDSIQVSECYGDSVLSEGAHEVETLVESRQLEKLKNYWEEIGKEPKEIQFMLCVEGDKMDAYCSSIRRKDEIISLWMFVPEKDRSIFYLQNAAHDFRSPLGSIIGVVNLLQHSLKSDDEFDKEEMVTLLDMIKVNSDKGLRLADEIMELAEIESDGYTLKKETVVLHDFVKNYLETHRLLTLRKRIKVNFDSESEAVALINESKMTRALDNILSNAVKFSKPGSTVTFKITEDNNQLRLDIKDQGIGMSPEIMKNVFVRFGNAKRNGLDGEPSHGLGMSIVRQIMKLHGGGVQITSKENMGTQVSLILNKAV
ncbi:sensor histidine kinase [Ekhidna sp.]|uniref:sensor histidine kinase n=1 Tax=Ekhidna sp. TaxID=2608089 RepID=UPI003CCBC8EC